MPIDVYFGGSEHTLGTLYTPDFSQSFFGIWDWFNLANLPKKEFSTGLFWGRTATA